MTAPRLTQKRYSLRMALLLALLWFAPSLNAAEAAPFSWPNNAVAALSLTFDDGRESQARVGYDLFMKYDARATFYVQPGAIQDKGWAKKLWGAAGFGNLGYWRDMVAAGHEIGSHTVNHPCSGQFSWVAANFATENYTPRRMASELAEAREKIGDLLDTDVISFSYPCGETRIGQDGSSYVPLVGEVYQSGRLYQHGTTSGLPENDPLTADLLVIRSISMDDQSFEDLLPLIEHARETGTWLVLGGHEIGTSGRQTTRVETLEKIIRYSQDPDNTIWLAPVKDVVGHILAHRSGETTPQN